jgi:branched-chain amino acid transport system permease protein
LILAAQYLLFTRTTVGKMLRATAQDAITARLMGIRVRRMIALTFVISAVLSGAAGFMLAPLVFVYPEVGTPLVVNGFIAAVIGGFGSVQGAVVGGILVGVAQVLLAAHVSSQWTDLFIFVALIGFLTFYPRGIFGETISEKA